jgi:erythromycin esterase
VDEVTIDWYARIGKLRSHRKKAPKHLVQEYMLVQKKANELLSLLQKTLDDLEKEFVKKYV